MRNIVLTDTMKLLHNVIVLRHPDIIYDTATETNKANPRGYKLDLQG